MAVKKDGTLWAWGDASSTGKLGKGNLTDYSSPVQVGTLTTWSKVAMSKGGTDFHSGAIKTDGTLWMWGGNSSGQLGKGNLTPYSSPVQVGSLTDWEDISLSWGTTLALKTNGTVWAWGDCTSGPFNTQVLYSSPVQVGSRTDWIAITNDGMIRTSQ
jgi:alpha-tubulin suppressor-like RCC1 family protein